MKIPESRTKQLLIGALCVIVIAACWTSIFLQRRNAQQINVRHHEGLGQAMAAEAHRLLEREKSKNILLIAPESNDPTLQAQLRAFHAALKSRPELEIEKTVLVKSDEKYRGVPGAGISARRFARVLNKARDVDLIVSFAGVPNPEHEEIKSLDLKGAKFIAESRQPPDRLKKLTERKLLHGAIVPRFTFPAPGPEKPKTTQEWFDRYFQVLRLEDT